MLTIAAVRDDEDEYTWLEGRTFHRRIVFEQDVFDEFEDNEAGRFNLYEVFEDDDGERVCFIDGSLHVYDHGWRDVEGEFGCDYEVQRFLTNSDVEFIFAWQRMMSIPSDIFTMKLRLDALDQFDDEISEAQCTVLFQVLPRDVVSKVFECL